VHPDGWPARFASVVARLMPTAHLSAPTAAMATTDADKSAPSRVAAMKKLINDPQDVVAEALLGIEAARPDVRVDHANRIIYRRDAPIAGKVGVVSGGGSGHEPLHGGYVGLGMLDAACAGQIFTSPTPDQMLEATKGVDSGAGVLHIVKNYTGDVMNFEMAAELAAADTGITVDSVVVNDDVAVEDSLYTAGRRGVGVTVLLEKLVGAAAEEGYSLSELAALARAVNESGRSMGMALTSCTVPAAGKPTFELAEDEMELGIGIHGEPGRRRVPLRSAREIAEQIMQPILADLDFTSSPVIVMVNGMGGTPLIELYLMYSEVAKIMEKAGITVARNLVGNYITSLEMAGCSVSVLRAKEEWLRLWDAPVNSAGLRWGI
jgi:dihydroxyacetone kinase-like protein